MYTQTTKHIKVTVQPVYLNDQSAPEDNLYVWAYTIQLENNSDRSVQLISRHWQITDAMGQVQEVKGPGVVGEQPMLKPGEAFQYTSGTSLPTPSGIMVGSYQMSAAEGDNFDIAIPAFSLDSPFQMGRPN
jgi:ApaG protein